MPASEPPPRVPAPALKRLATSLVSLGPVRFVVQEVVMMRPTVVTEPQTAHVTVQCRRPGDVHAVLKGGGGIKDAFGIGDFAVEAVQARSPRGPKLRRRPTAGHTSQVEAFTPALCWLRDAGADDPRVQLGTTQAWLMRKGSVSGPSHKQSSRFVWTDGPTEVDLAGHLDAAGVNRNRISAGRYLSPLARARIAVHAAAMKGSRHQIKYPGEERLPKPMPLVLEDIAAVVAGLAAEQDVEPGAIISQLGLDALERLVS